mmetsp:Transcript_16853/g.27963  ORF Transcript_16853/g.27963 Transcript_16853/m.27963 type:complete len:229 (-) Transcript_16853:438-1124(-)
MIFASEATIDEMTVATSFTSCSDMSEVPVIVKTTPLAFSMGKSSRGDETAASAASRARVLPKPLPIPMRAGPALLMTERTSAKSTFIRPGLTTMSEMPVMPCRKISSARENASCSGTPSGTISSSLSFETTIRMSTCCCNSSIASSACCMRRRPSKEKGFVTMPTVRQPACLASSATTGAAPDPVPPPMPAVTNTISTPRTSASTSAAASIAEALPTDGMPPAPNPRA